MVIPCDSFHWNFSPISVGISSTKSWISTWVKEWSNENSNQQQKTHRQKPMKPRQQPTFRFPLHPPPHQKQQQTFQKLFPNHPSPHFFHSLKPMFLLFQRRFSPPVLGLLLHWAWGRFIHPICCLFDAAHGGVKIRFFQDLKGGQTKRKTPMMGLVEGVTLSWMWVGHTSFGRIMSEFILRDSLPGQKKVWEPGAWVLCGPHPFQMKVFFGKGTKVMMLFYVSHESKCFVWVMNI